MTIDENDRSRRRQKSKSSQAAYLKKLKQAIVSNMVSQFTALPSGRLLENDNQKSSKRHLTAEK
jgi:hypothetical protein